MTSRTDVIRLGAVAVIVLGLDQLTKALVVGSLGLGEEVELIGPLSLNLTYNDGIAFGLAGGAGGLVIVFSLIALVLLGIFIRSAPSGWLTDIAGGLILGGAAGNLVDRLLAGRVTDFIALPWWPTFNVADIGITVGVILLVASVLKGDRDRTHERTA